MVEIDSKEIARKNKNKEVSIWHLLMSIITTPKKSEIKFIDTKTLKNIKQEVAYEIDKLEKILIEKNEIIIPKINKEIFTLIKEAKKEFKSKSLIGAKEIFYQILKNKKLLKKHNLSKSNFNFKDQNILEYMGKNKVRLIETYKEFDEEIRLENEHFEIEKYVKNLTALAKTNKLDPLIGREAEIKTLTNILLRRNKNSAMLLGEPGVGKTAIVEGLASRIVQKKISSKLQDKTILMLKVSNLVSGTKYRGEFEDRLNNIVKHIEKNKNIIIFIDEIHTLIGAGNSEGALDASNILKPSLSRAEIQIIGATTYNEYRKYISKDKAFARRFQTIAVREPDEKDTLQIIENIAKNFEDYHGVIYEKSALLNIVKLSSKYLINKKFPDKAIDIIDIAGAAKKEGITKDNIITSDDIQKAINEILSINTTNNTKEEILELKKIESEINKKVIGQKHAVSELIKEIIKVKLEINDDSKPLASILLIGSSGCGKTALINAISKKIIKDQNSVLRLDMSDYKEENSISKLIGTNPGYVGYSDGGILTNKLKHSFETLILFENIENAHNSVLTLISRMLENGELIDSKEDKILFKNTIIIMTTNIGSRMLLGEKNIGFNKNQQKSLETKNFNEEIKQDLEKRFKLSFLDKIQKKIILNVLTKDNIEEICKNYLNALKTKFYSKGIEIEIQNDVDKFITTKYYKKISGARSVIAAIKEQIEENIITKIAENQNINKITIYLEKEKIIIE
ncbi:ATP-dependent Clp protease ATP-binding subunit [Borreliella andersonii]|uniref:ATP-dependent Clp protease ATP-binding subunit n=1 Tax=Borrelia andersonii TaxID=42109 RepID=UPI00292D1FBA|nr:ATP-dependent Clp protease ATP-binding subunit [Borreliella andersonii]WNY69931.1 ATP-dependent Clp protease ATP-binding subunit [Borreliella andersonii]